MPLLFVVTMKQNRYLLSKKYIRQQILILGDFKFYVVCSEICWLIKPNSLIEYYLYTIVPIIDVPFISNLKN